MRCCVLSCNNTFENTSQSDCITFHSFPSEVHLRAAWLRALGTQDSHLPDSAVVCSQHFLNDDIYETESGLRQIVTGAIPSTVQVCMICLDTDSKLILMSKHKLEETYGKLTGHPLCDRANLKPTLCVQCAQRLINFSRFRDKSLRARALMMDLVDKHELITLQHIKMINRTKHQLKSSMVLTTLGPDHCDLYILEHPSEDKQTELEEIGLRDVVKTEESDDSMSVDVDVEVKHEEDNNVNDFVWDPLKYESVCFQCTLCLEEFFHEHAYMQHMCMHLQNGAGDGECDTSQVCKPHTAVSSSSSHSSLITENKQADPSPSTRAAQTTVAPVSATFATNNENKVHTTKEADAEKKVKQVLGGLQIKTDDINNIQCNNSSQYTSSSRTAKSSFICDICGKNYKQKSLLVIHIRTHSEVRRFTCKICQHKYKLKSDLTQHVRTHTQKKPFTCNFCNYKCTRSSHLMYHMSTHTGIKPYACALCEYKCAIKSYLVSHLRIHTGEKPYSCNICERQFIARSGLVRHMSTHSGIKPYACELCEYKCARKSSLVSHMRTHTGEKPHSCAICEYKCSEKSSLNNHMMTHTGEKPFTCKICNKKFAKNNHLVYHMSTHTGIKPYACELCEYKCAQKSDLVCHMRTHTGERPYSCQKCEYKCARKTSLVKHMRSH